MYSGPVLLWLVYETGPVLFKLSVPYVSVCVCVCGGGGLGILRRDTHLNTILTLTLTPILFMPR